MMNERNDQDGFVSATEEELDNAAGGRRWGHVNFFRGGARFYGGYGYPGYAPAYAAPAVPAIMPPYGGGCGMPYAPYSPYGMRLGTAI